MRKRTVPEPDPTKRRSFVVLIHCAMLPPSDSGERDGIGEQVEGHTDEQVVKHTAFR